MDLFPLPGAIDIRGAAAREVAVAESLAIARHRQPRSLPEILAEASRRMDAEDAMQDAFVAYLDGRPTGIRHPRKRLRACLVRPLKPSRWRYDGRRRERDGPSESRPGGPVVGCVRWLSGPRLAVE